MKLVIILSLATAAAAQTNSSSGTLGAVISSSPIGGQVIGGQAAGWVFSSTGPLTSRGALTGMPYSAEQITENVQTLADGTRITQPAQKVKLYRDSQGRTRTERNLQVPFGGALPDPDAPIFIEISDPVNNVHYTLEPRNHVARKFSVPPIPPPPPPPAAGSATAARSNGLVGGFGTALPPSLPDTQAQRPQVTHEDLGTQTIEGLLAQGSRNTMTYPVGAIGNDRPISTVSETWMSRELNMAVLSTFKDPRNGDSTTRLTNLSRSEPDPSLFQIPSDYEVVDQNAIRKQ